MDSLQADASVSVFADMKRGHELRSKLSDITNGLKLHEKISVVFLLCNEPQDGVEIIDLIQRQPDLSAQNNSFYKWMRAQPIFTRKTWREEFAEVLTIIQNYRLAKILGFQKTDLKKKFMPDNNLKTVHVSNVRKVLYKLCEELPSFEELVNLVESSDDVSKAGKFLEVKLLSWSEENMISLKKSKEIDLSVLVQCLRKLSLNNLANDIEVVAEKANCHLVRHKSNARLDVEEFDYYQITDLNNLGLCVIINEKNFTNSLFPKRWGSDKDVERLLEVFTTFGFQIKIHNDVTYKQLMTILEHYSDTMDKNISFFVLIILSHGSENVIYTSDSIPVDMNTIEMMFQAESCQSLIGKPKIFIIQSCQGEKWQKVLVQEENEEIEADNLVVPNKKQVVTVGPQKGDSVIAWSTVQGFASFRDRYNGSWYIQELCNELWKYGDALDLVEIFTRTNNNLRSKVYGGQFMVPSLVLSVRAKIKFPRSRENFLKGRKLMVERLIFEKCFREFLVNYGGSELAALIKT